LARKRFVLPEKRDYNKITMSIDVDYVYSMPITVKEGEER